MPLSTKVRVAVTADLTAALDLVTASVPLSKDYVNRLATGVASGQADKIFHDQRTLAASGTENLDLAGSLVDAFGATITFVKLKAIIVKAASTNVNNVNVIREGTNGAPLFLALADGIPVLPDGIFAWVAPGAGITVTAGTGDLLTFTNSGAGTSVTYDIVLVGTSA